MWWCDDDDDVHHHHHDDCKCGATSGVGRTWYNNHYLMGFGNQLITGGASPCRYDVTWLCIWVDRLDCAMCRVNHYLPSWRLISPKNEWIRNTWECHRKDRGQKKYFPVVHIDFENGAFMFEWPRFTHENLLFSHMLKNQSVSCWWWWVGMALKFLWNFMWTFVEFGNCRSSRTWKTNQRLCTAGRQLFHKYPYYDCILHVLDSMSQRQPFVAKPR